MYLVKSEVKWLVNVSNFSIGVVEVGGLFRRVE